MSKKLRPIFSIIFETKCVANENIMLLNLLIFHFNKIREVKVHAVSVARVLHLSKSELGRKKQKNVTLLPRQCQLFQMIQEQTCDLNSQFRRKVSTDIKC